MIGYGVGLSIHLPHMSMGHLSKPHFLLGDSDLVVFVILIT